MRYAMISDAPVEGIAVGVVIDDEDQPAALIQVGMTRAVLDLEYAEELARAMEVIVVMLHTGRAPDGMKAVPLNSGPGKIAKSLRKNRKRLGLEP